MVYWQEDGCWLGYLEEFPDYWTQGETLEDLEEHLHDLHADLTSGELPGASPELPRRIRTSGASVVGEFGNLVVFELMLDHPRRHAELLG